MGKRDRDRLQQISRNMAAPTELQPYTDDQPDRLTPVNVTATDGAKVTINLGTMTKESSLPPVPKDSMGRHLADAFRQLPRGQKLAAYLGTLVFLGYLVASGTKLAGLW